MVVSDCVLRMRQKETTTALICKIIEGVESFGFVVMSIPAGWADTLLP